MGRNLATVFYRYQSYILLLLMTICHSNCQKRYPAFFIFGDSVVDAGNNNYMLSLARANFYPYGIDFSPGSPFRATGRFCNGKTVVDFIGEYLNLPLIPPYLNPSTKGPRILKGVNYASAAAGILPATGADLIGRRNFDGQIEWFGNTIRQVDWLLGKANSATLIKNALYAVIIGANDYINNYLIAPPASRMAASDFQDRLLGTFQNQLTNLYNMAARNIFVSGIGPLGCIPSQLALRSNDGNRSEEVNSLAQNFNAALQQRLHQLNAKHQDAQFRYADVYNPIIKYVSSPSLYGFQVAKQACCGTGHYRGQGGCLPRTAFCPNRTAYVFWDPYHPTQEVNEKLGYTLIDMLM